MFLLSKILSQLVSPLALCLLLVPLGLLLHRFRWRRTGRSLVGFGLGWLLLWSLPMPSLWLCSSLEQQSLQRSAKDYPAMAAIVVLGGGIDAGRPGWRDDPDLKSAADRVWFAAQLYHAGRAPLVILSGGSLDVSGAVRSEASAMALFIADLGVPASALLLEENSRNTWENARYSSDLLRPHAIDGVLLVTSALHMPRASALFRRQGINVVEAATDFEAVPPEGPWLVRWLPDARALDASTRGPAQPTVHPATAARDQPRRGWPGDG